MTWADTARIVDTSHWQPEPMDWATAMRDGNLAAVIVKVSQGLGGIDPVAGNHVKNTAAAGVPLQGAYHFGDDSDPAQQAKHFLDIAHVLWGDLSRVMLMLDAERNTPQMSVHQAEIFISTIFALTRRWAWLYMGKSGPDGTGRGLPSRVLSNCPLLVAAYGNHASNLAAILPKGWRLPGDGVNRGETGTGVLRGWQFTDGKINGGPFPGLGPVDQSRFIGVASLAEATAVWRS